MSQNLKILRIVPVGSTVAETPFICIRYIDNCLRNSMLTDLLGYLAIIAVHDHAIPILKTDICNVYMSIHLRQMSSLLLMTVDLFGIIHLLRSPNFCEKLTFLLPDTHTYLCVSGVKKCQFFGKFCDGNKQMIPWNTSSLSSQIILQKL